MEMKINEKKKMIKKNTGKNKRAIVLTLDAFLAVLIIAIALSMSAIYMLKERNVLPEIQTARIGSDIAALLENSGVAETFNENFIKSYVNSALSGAYGMRINITWDNAQLTQLRNMEFGDEIPIKKFVATGKRFFAVTNSSMVKNYALIKYWIWKK